MRGRVVLGVTGGIAAFRAVELLRLLTRAGCEVTPILTRNAARFVSPRTFAALADRPAQVSMWGDATRPGVDHIAIARMSDLLLVAPATADVLAKMAAGVADDALSTYALAHRRAVVVAPAMNTYMWRHPATRESIRVLGDRGVEIVAPATGELACRDVGEGKLAAVEAIFAAALEALPPRGPFAGVRMLVTAGPTREPVDAVRVITNRSSGRMGTAIAAAGRELGADVTLLAGAGVPVPEWVPVQRFETAADLQRLLEREAPRADVVWHAAAVADFRPREAVAGKMDRRDGGTTLELEPVPDLAAGLPKVGGRPYLVVFAAEMSGRLEERAARKLEAKGARAVVANPIDEPGAGMESDMNRAVVLTSAGLRRDLPLQDKDTLARELLFTVLPEVLAGP